MSDRWQSEESWRYGDGERPAQPFYVVGERGSPAQLVDAERPEERIIAEAAAFVHGLADRVEALRRGLQGRASLSVRRRHTPGKQIC